MRTRPIPMTWEEFEMLPRRRGWKHEYLNGKAYLRPRESAAVVRMAVIPRPIFTPNFCAIRLATPEDAPKLTPAFFDAFRHSFDYWGWTQKAIRASAQDSIASLFAGKRGPLHPASRLAVSTQGRRTVLGAALLVHGADASYLDLLFVRPGFQRAGLATALVQSAVNALHDLGETHLGSAYTVANEPSAAWHARFGFVEEPDLSLSRERFFIAQDELRRRQKIGDLTEPERQDLERQSARWETIVDELEQIAKRDGYEAVCPLLRRHRKRT